MNGTTQKPKVICLGLGRTGTTSLRGALETLGFGPCYNFRVIMEKGLEQDLDTWSKIGDGNGTPDDVKSLLENYGCATAYPVALYPAEIYAAYPDAKFILTVRDPEKWEKSMQSTLMMGEKKLRSHHSRTPLQERMLDWNEKYLQEKYHRGRMETHAQQELLDHNERVKKVFPLEKLLIYTVGEGWERLVDFLEVPTPAVPFPHLNNTAQYQERVQSLLCD